MALATRSLLVSAAPKAKAKANSNLVAPASSSSSTSSLSCLEPQARLVSSFYGAGVKSQQRCQNGGQARGGSSSSCKALKWWASSSSKKEARKHEVSSLSLSSSWFCQSSSQHLCVSTNLTVALVVAFYLIEPM